jgi:LysR family transcriptional activator of nhaA
MINLKHLHYFHEVAQAGSIAKAAERLNLTPQTISGQLALLEDALGVELFERRGRALMISEAGRLATEYTNDIFALTNELQAVLQQMRGGPSWRLRVGISDAVPKSMATQLLAPVLAMPEQVTLTVQEDNLHDLLGKLALHRLDLIISDSPLPANVEVRAYCQSLGESQLSFFAAPDLAHKLKNDFPASLNNTPMLLQSQQAHMRKALTSWFQAQEIQPQIVGEFDDSAMAQAFGQQAAGVFVAPSVIAEDICQQHKVECLGHIPVQTSLYAITAQRKLSHPAMEEVLKGAESLFLNSRE